jgi:protein-tyrosine-phosphatase
MADTLVDVSPHQFLQLVADPQRWQLLTALSASDRRVGELSDLLGKPQNLVSYHLRELRNAGLVAGRRSSADGRDTYYRVDLPRCGDLLSAVGTAIDPALRLEVLPAAPARSPRGRRPRVLFLCTGNSARSQMAEALLDHRSGHCIVARSAGSSPKELHPSAVQVMAEHGIDISHHTTKHMSRFARNRFDRVITLCDKVREICPEFPGQPTTAHWSMADPSAEDDPDAFVRTADELETRIGALIAQLTDHREKGITHAR